MMGSRNVKYPATLAGFGYGFDQAGRLRQLDSKTGAVTDKSFEFQVSSSHAENQARYEALGEVITNYVFDLLENEGLKKLPLPKDSGEDGTFIFATPDAFTNHERLLILIHGSGVVRAGQWARSLIINDSLESGTQLPFIKKAKDLGYGVIVLNTNDNQRLINGKKVPIKGSEDPSAHARTAWEEYVMGQAKAKHVFMVAHSYGGVATLALVNHHFSSLQNRVVAIAMTDSVHSFLGQKLSSDVTEYLKRVGRNWVASDDALDTPVGGDERDDDIPRVSAGHKKHEMTSFCSMESIFKFFQERLADASQTQNL